MSDAPTRRSLYLNGFILLLLAFVAGFPVTQGNAYDAKLWLAAHITGILAGLVVVAVGAVWDELKLSNGLLSVTRALVLGANYTVFLILGVANAALGAPLKALGLKPPPLDPPIPAGLQNGIMGAGIAVALMSLAWVGLVIYGLRGTKDD